MVEKTSFYFDVTAADNDASLIARGDAHGRVSLKAGADRLIVVVEGEPTGECLLECFHAGIEQKILLPDMESGVRPAAPGTLGRRRHGQRACRISVSRHGFWRVHQDSQRNVHARAQSRLHRSHACDPMARRVRAIGKFTTRRAGYL